MIRKNNHIAGRRRMISRMVKASLFLLGSPYIKLPAMNPKGVIVKPSKYPVKDSIDRIRQFLEGQGVTIYSRIDQQSELSKAGLQIAPLEFIMFGKPKAGGPLMVNNPLSALDLPLKIVAWEDEQQKVWIAYNDPAWIRDRYNLPEAISAPLNLDPIVAKALA